MDLQNFIRALLFPKVQLLLCIVTIKAQSKLPTIQFFMQNKKHIELDVHYIRDLVQAATVNLQFCPSEEQTVDIFTKSMTEAKFLKLRGMLGMLEVNINGG